MNYEGMVKAHLFSLVFFEDQIDEIFEILKNESFEMEERWKDDENDMPPSIKPLLLFKAEIAALDWLNKNGKSHIMKEYLESRITSKEKENV